MFSRVDYSEWHTLFPKIGFALFAIAFLIILWRAFKMSKSDQDAAAHLPLEDD